MSFILTWSKSCSIDNQLYQNPCLFVLDLPFWSTAFLLLGDYPSLLFCSEDFLGLLGVCLRRWDLLGWGDLCMAFLVSSWMCAWAQLLRLSMQWNLMQVFSKDSICCFMFFFSSSCCLRTNSLPRSLLFCSLTIFTNYLALEFAWLVSQASLSLLSISFFNLVDGLSGSEQPML